jgi:hypothetical protein
MPTVSMGRQVASVSATLKAERIGRATLPHERIDPLPAFPGIVGAGRY